MSQLMAVSPGSTPGSQSPRSSRGDVGDSPHFFELKTCTHPQWCKFCRTMIGFGTKAFSCKGCKYFCHKRCQEDVPNMCPVPYVDGEKGGSVGRRKTVQRTSSKGRLTAPSKSKSTDAIARSLPLDRGPPTLDAPNDPNSATRRKSPTRRRGSSRVGSLGKRSGGSVRERGGRGGSMRKAYPTTVRPYEPSRYEDEAVRLRSFNKRGWTIDTPSGELLASLGFYYTPTDVKPNKVTCWRCRRSLSRWTVDDDPQRMHQRVSIACPVAQGDDPKLDKAVTLRFASSRREMRAAAEAAAAAAAVPNGDSRPETPDDSGGIEEDGDRPLLNMRASLLDEVHKELLQFPLNSSSERVMVAPKALALLGAPGDVQESLVNGDPTARRLSKGKKSLSFQKKKMKKSMDKGGSLKGSQGIVSMPYNIQHKTHVDQNFEWSGKEDPEEAFEFTDELGRGAYGAVMRAEHRNSGFPLAVKFVPAEDAGARETLRKEVDILKSCNCENVLAYYGTVPTDDQIWILMDFCGGGSIKDIMKATLETLEEDQLAEVLVGALKGLEYLHGRDTAIYHMDIKSANILMTDVSTGAPVVKIADFGVSEQLQRTSTMVELDDFVGSPLFMAPEVIAKAGFNDRADIWSLGICVIEMAEGRPPNTDIRSMEALPQLLKRAPPTLHTPKLWSAMLNDFLRKCLVKDPASRPSATELLKHPFVQGAVMDIAEEKMKALSENRLTTSPMASLVNSAMETTERKRVRDRQQRQERERQERVMEISQKAEDDARSHTVSAARRPQTPQRQGSRRAATNAPPADIAAAIAKVAASTAVDDPVAEAVVPPTNRRPSTARFNLGVHRNRSGSLNSPQRPYIASEEPERRSASAGGSVQDLFDLVAGEVQSEKSTNGWVARAPRLAASQPVPPSNGDIGGASDEGSDDTSGDSVDVASADVGAVSGEVAAPKRQAPEPPDSPPSDEMEGTFVEKNDADDEDASTEE